MLSGRLALVTGAGSGIGRATALALGHQGADVLLVGRRLEPLQALAHELRQAPGAVHVALADVRDEKAVTSVFEQLVRPLDILVVNAGVCQWGRVTDFTLDSWRTVLEINLQGAFLCARAAVHSMQRSGGGQIIFVASGAAKRGRPGWGAYCASKAGLMAFAESLAEEVRDLGIRVHTVVPGAVETPFWAGNRMPDETLRPEDVADAICYLAGLPDGVSVPEFRIRPARAAGG